MQSAYIHLYLIMINVITFALYGLDKWRAMTRQWRVREKKYCNQYYYSRIKCDILYKDREREEFCNGKSIFDRA